MKAVVYDRYGSIEQLKIEEINKPRPRDNEVLIRINAVSINASDWELLRGKPLYARIYGLFRPRSRILGSDISGEVVAVGSSADKFRPGERVCGDIFDSRGGFAEYVCVKEKYLSPVPDGMSDVDAAAIPQAGCIALQGLRESANLQPGQRILINGAGGGAGSFAIQIGKLMGAHVTAVDRQSKLPFMRSLGADAVVDFQQQDFTQSNEKYEVILDMVGKRSIFDLGKVLTERGQYFMVGGTVGNLFSMLFLGSLLSLLGKKKFKIMGLRQNLGLSEVLNMVREQKIRVPIEAVYALQETPQALGKLGKGEVSGKVVISLEQL